MWDQNYKHGFGIFTFQDGEQYIGRFHNDKMIDYNAYGFSIPNVSKNYERISSAKSKQDGKGKNPPQNSLSINDAKAKETTPIKVEDMNKSPEENLKENLNAIENNLMKSDSLKKNLNPIQSTQKLASGLEAISEQAELFNNSVLMPPDNNKSKENPQLQSNFRSGNNTGMTIDTKLNPTTRKGSMNINGGKNVASFIKEKKEKEFNIFKTLIDINDLIECDPDIENNLRDIEHTLLRNLSEMKVWYRYYTNKDNQKEENQSVNASDDKDKDKVSRHSEKRTVKQGDNQNQSSDIKEKNKVTPVDKFEGVYSNDLSFGMELKDLWKFLRESNILCLEFSLAQFNRLFFKGNKNYIEMFMYPEDVHGKSKIYDYIYYKIIKSKNEFSYKYRERLFTTNITNNLFGQPVLTNNIVNSNSTPNETVESVKYTENNNNINLENNTDYKNFLEKVNQKEQIYFNDNVHNKRQTILLRHFYEAILRSAFLRYSHLSICLHSKINNLIDTCIKTNINFKKVSRKSQMQQTESSINSSMVIDMKPKSFESNFEFFTGNFEDRLKLSFKKLFNKSNTHNRMDDMTVTYRFFFEKVIKKSEILTSLFDKPKFVELINIYHKDKQTYTEGQKITKEQIIYFENLLDMEFIFYEYCELIFFITRKILTKNNLNENRENYSTHISEIEELVDNLDSAATNEKLFYSFPKLKNHFKFDDLIATQKAREEEELRKKMEQKRIERERNLMQVEDTNILPELIDEDDDEEDSSIYSNY